MKKSILILSTACLLTACSSNSNGPIQLSVNQIDGQHYGVSLPADRTGANADSSFLRQVHRQTIDHKFMNEQICPQGLIISSPTTQHHTDDSYQLHYDVSCKQG